MISKLAGIAYLGAGVFVANTYLYLTITGLATLLSAFLAVTLWPLVVLGVDLHVSSF
jgi:hypothetical protein